MSHGDKALVGNKGYRRFLQSQGTRFTIDTAKVEDDARYDGLWVLRTDTDLEPLVVALAYKHLWMVKAIFRSMKSVIETRPIYHQRDEHIRGHVFCSFLALVLRQELERRLAARRWSLEWADVMRDLDALGSIEKLTDSEVTIAGVGSYGDQKLRRVSVVSQRFPTLMEQIQLILRGHTDFFFDGPRK